MRICISTSLILKNCCIFSQKKGMCPAAYAFPLIVLIYFSICYSLIFSSGHWLNHLYILLLPFHFFSRLFFGSAIFLSTTTCSSKQEKIFSTSFRLIFGVTKLTTGTTIRPTTIAIAPALIGEAI